MALSKTVKTNTEDNNPTLRKWGKIVSCRIFANSSIVDAGVETAFLNAVEAIRSGNERPEFCVESQRNVELLCYLPYVVGFACASGYLHRVQVDLSKPILFVFNSNSAVTGLVDATSYRQPSTRPQPPLLQSKGILTREEIESGAHYKCRSLSESDIPDGVSSSNPDVVLCTQRLPLPPASSRLLCCDSARHVASHAHRIPSAQQCAPPEASSFQSLQLSSSSQQRG